MSTPQRHRGPTPVRGHMALTDRGRIELGLGPTPTVDTVGVPLLDLPWFDDKAYAEREAQRREAGR